LRVINDGGELDLFEEVKLSNRGSMMEEVVHETSWYAFVLQDGMLLSSKRLITHVYPLLLGMTFARVHF
jgi:hypothetical protein